MGMLEDDLDYGLKLSRLQEHNRAITDKILERATWEVARTQLRFPQPNYTTLKVAEEAGEVVRGAVHYAEKRASWDDLENEVVQMIAMGLRLLIEGDQINGVIPPINRS